MPSQFESAVVVAYSGVHEAFQIALAAEELGFLDAFYGSVFDAPGQFGRSLQGMLGCDTLTNRRWAGKRSEVLREIPWPFIRNRLAAKFPNIFGSYPWYEANFDFDRKVAAKIRQSSARLLVCTETCAHDSFLAAGERGIRKVLDCPQAHPTFLTYLLDRAAEDLKIPPPPPFDPPELAARKAEEFALADLLLLISDVQQRSFVEAGFAPERMVMIPLWVDREHWFPPIELPATETKKSTGILKVLFVGNIGLRKGIPYLMQAIEKCGTEVELTLVGVNSGEADAFLKQTRQTVKLAGKKNKVDLREVYWKADVLVLPSLIDTFGFVALEAMACGLPVIVTENCGVPVPDPDWQVPIMNSDAIAARLEFYARDRAALLRDGKQAAEFAMQYTPERYREAIKALLHQMLCKEG